MATKVKQGIDGLLSHIRRGEYTPDEMWMIYHALATALWEGAVGHRWRITIPGLCDFTEDDLSLLATAQVETRLGARASDIDPKGSARTVLELVRAHLEVDKEWDHQRVADQLKHLKQSDAFEALSWFPVGPDPKDTPASVSPPETS